MSRFVPGRAGVCAALLLLALAPAAAAQDGPAVQLLDRLLASLPAGSTLTYASVTGSAAESTVLDLQVGDGQAGVISVGSLVLTDIGEQAAGAAFPPIGRVLARDISMVKPDGDGSLRVAQLDVVGVDLPTLVALAQGADVDPLVLLNAKRIALEGFDFDGPLSEPDLTLARLSIDGISDGFVQSARLEDMRIVQPQGEDAGSMRIGSIAIDAFNARPMLEAAITGLDPTSFFPELELGRFELLDLDMDVPGAVGTIRQVLVDDLERVQDKVTGLHLQFDGVFPTGGMAPEQRAVFDALGLQSLPIRLDYRHRIDPATNVMSIAPFDLEIAGAGALSVDLQLAGFPTQAYVEDSPALSAGFMGLSLQSARFSYTDASLMPRVLALAAAQGGRTATELVDGLVMQFQMMAPPDSPSAQAVLQAVTTFLRDPGQLLITARPAVPQPVLALGMAGGSNPFALIDMLGLTVEAR